MRAGHHQLLAAAGLPRGAHRGGAGARHASSCKRSSSGNRSSNSKRAAAAAGEGRELRCIGEGNWPCLPLTNTSGSVITGLMKCLRCAPLATYLHPLGPACYLPPSLPLCTSLRLRCTLSRTSARALTWRCSAATSTWRCRAPRSWTTRTPGTGWVSGDRLGEPRFAVPGLTRHLAIACGVHVGPCAQLQCAT